MTPEAASVVERAAAGEQVTGDGQQGLFDVEITNDLLEAALERRFRAMEKAKKVKAEEKEAKDAVKGMIGAIPEVAAYDLESSDPLVVRCGRFRITVKTRKGTDVAFSTSPRKATTISLLPVEE